MADELLCLNSCGWHHYLLYFHENTVFTLKKGFKIGAPKFWPSHHYSRVVQTASNWNLQKVLRSEL